MALRGPAPAAASRIASRSSPARRIVNPQRLLAEAALHSNCAAFAADFAVFPPAVAWLAPMAAPAELETRLSHPSARSTAELVQQGPSGTPDEERPLGERLMRAADPLRKERGFGQVTGRVLVRVAAVASVAVACNRSLVVDLAAVAQYYFLNFVGFGGPLVCNECGSSKESSH